MYLGVGGGVMLVNRGVGGEAQPLQISKALSLLVLVGVLMVLVVVCLVLRVPLLIVIRQGKRGCLVLAVVQLAGGLKVECQWAVMPLTQLAMLHRSVEDWPAQLGNSS